MDNSLLELALLAKFVIGTPQRNSVPAIRAQATDVSNQVIDPLITAEDYEIGNVSRHGRMDALLDDIRDIL